MGNSSEKKISISSANPIVITANTPISKPSLLLYAAVTISLLGSVGLGLVVGYISPVLDQITDAKNPKDAQARTWLGSITTLGALFGGLLAPVLVKFLGKKLSLSANESPSQILSQNKLDDFVIKRARNELAKLRSPDSAIDEELDELIKAQKALNEITDEKLSEKISKADFYKPLTYSLGINAIIFYANSIFKSASETINVAVASSILSLTMTLTTVVEVLIIDKLGRRLILILSGIGCAIGLAPVPWMMVPELSPVNNRTFISGCSTAFNWGIAFLVDAQ
ncbi:hypothetical protein RND71_043347 [Anisodus tanguticus]|uniref:Major facilitator superfamily (MFS) profile domain-containing protein n=1 Tax=Anisodus tanguticus TaxID=243964 RepID=A0AAE1QPJ8_9SOLA|nr:hypothetical protein RND71_043347 [Anisodus tanguticus]